MRKKIFALILLLAINKPAFADSVVAGPTGNALQLSGGTLTGPLLVTGGTAAAPGIALAGAPTNGLILSSAVTYFVRSGVESVGMAVSGSTAELRLCTSGAAGCGSASSLRASPTWTGISNNALAHTAGTMTEAVAGSNGKLSTSTSSYSWTNAMVVALGATTSGDITVMTIPARTQVVDVGVVVTGQAAGTTTLTIQCGDAVAAGTFNTLIVASSIQAAVNTFYGDAVAERGTSIDTEWYYMPSFTAPTVMTCRFISTGANLSAVTGSSGTVFVTTRVL